VARARADPRSKGSSPGSRLGTRNPRPPHDMNAGTGDPSAHVKRAVWLRDLGRCAFVGTNGHRCNERRFVQFHHVDPRALGGEATVDMIELRCRSHNDYEGRLYFGKRRRAHDGGLVREQPAPYRSCPSTPGELVLEQVAYITPDRVFQAAPQWRRRYAKYTTMAQSNVAQNAP